MRDSEKTRQKILNTAQNLFFEKGYDKTSMQDIMNVGGLTKGAIYHHFKSKKDIFDKIMYGLNDNGKSVFSIMSNQELSGLKKLQKLVCINLENKEKAQILSNASSLFLDNKVYGEIIRENEKFQSLVTDIIVEGNKDGSLKVEYPIELAEIFIQFFNIWLGTQLYELPEGKICSKVSFYTKLFKNNGMNIIDQEVSELIYKYTAILK